MVKILISTSSFDPESAGLTGLCKARGYEIVMNPHGRRLTENEVRALLDPEVVGMVAGVEPLTRAVLAAASGLRVISRCGIGMDSVDLQATREFGIRVFNSPDAPSTAVAELTVALMLDALHRVSEADRAVRNGLWQPLMGRLLRGKTVGLIGYGRIGRKVSQLVQAFEARVIAHDVACPASEPGVVLCDLDQLLSTADIVSLHIPYADSNRHLLNAARLAMMRPGAILINASRGGLVDEAALLDAVESGRVAAVALDTFESEPYHGPLAKLSQVVLTAHMGSYAREARSLMEREAATNLVRGLSECGLVDREAVHALAGRET